MEAAHLFRQGPLWNKRQKEHFCNFGHTALAPFLANRHIFQKEALKRCLSESFLKDLSYICNFNTLECAADHTLPKVFLSSDGTTVYYK